MYKNEISKPTVLVVDDMTTNLVILSDLLKNDYNVLVANSGQKAIEITNASNKIDIILLDIIMPEMDGYQVCKHLKLNFRTKDIPIIFVTAKDSDEDEAFGLDLGAIDYITKPYNETIVKLRIKNHLELKLKNDMFEELLKKHLELKLRSDMFEELSMYDGLTKIANRRFFDKVFDTSYKEIKRSNRSLALLMLDIDHFKLYNDSYGHKVGDDMLLSVARALKKSLKRPTDFIARYGGEEFVVLLKDIQEKEAENVAKKLIKAVEKLKIEHISSPTNNIVTVSVGVAQRQINSEVDKLDILIAADEMLYEVKRSGRNNYKITLR